MWRDDTPQSYILDGLIRDVALRLDAGYDVAVHENVAALFLVKHEENFHEKITPVWDHYLDRK